MREPVRPNQSGFTLLEVLIAFVIMALTLAVLFRGMAASLRATRAAGQYEEGLSRAQSHLDAITAPGVGISPRVEKGDEGHGFSWRIEIKPMATGTAVRQQSSDGPGPRLTLYAATVTETWHGGANPGEITLRTELLGPPPP